MGRALYSTYPVRSEPHPEPQHDACERWSPLNSFDPDSDDFFQNAQYEAFIDHVLVTPLPPISSIDDPSDTSDPAAEPSAHSSPMAIGFDDPAVLISDAYVNRSWTSHPRALPSPYPNAFPVLVAPTPTSPTDPSPPPFIPPVMFREPSPAPTPPAPRPSHINPVRIPIFPPEAFSRSPSPRTPSPPSTPPVHAAYPHFYSHSMLTPSPAPSVTPRFYRWDEHDTTSTAFGGRPESPTRASHPHRDTPLTHSRARMSFARIETSPVVLTAHGR